MAHFTCARCGKCCQNFGPYLRIERELDEGRYYCHCSLSGEYFYAQRSGELQGDPMETRVPPGKHTPCPFLYREEEGLYSCAIYPSRPAFCREYRCSHMDILDARGNRIGKVGGRKSLLSADPALHALWKREIDPLMETPAEVWCSRAREILEKGGYQVILYD